MTTLINNVNITMENKLLAEQIARRLVPILRMNTSTEELLCDTSDPMLVEIRDQLGGLLDTLNHELSYREFPQLYLQKEQCP